MTVRIGILGSATDPQCELLRVALTARGAQVVLVESQALNQGARCAFDGTAFWHADQRLDDVDGWFVRHAMSPLPPTFERDGDFRLFADWYVAYMQRRERYGFQLSLLLGAVRRGVPVVNPPTHGQLVQLKPLQLAIARGVGLAVPRTLITSDPWRARAFIDEVGTAVYKPSMGGGPCCPVDGEALARLAEIAVAPVTFQERVCGTPVRVIALADSVLAAVAIPTDAVDYRTGSQFVSGQQAYQPVALDDEVRHRCGALLRECGLQFSAVDFVQRADGRLVFLEANSSPTYLDIERASGLPITDRLADRMLELAGTAPAPAVVGPSPARSFAAYAVPFAPERLVGGPGRSPVDDDDVE
ncbi:MAG: hypothetical protein JXR83_12305 [Deltaproteobacteria bacterium]|nr:hypothetical protein [Deltaproteobacteria bacterium]